MPRWPTRELVGGQGVRSNLESEGFEENSRVASSRPFFGRLGLPPMMFDPQLGEPIEFV
jgi:hypothetical protein